jgi:hypothetical protein
MEGWRGGGVEGWRGGVCGGVRGYFTAHSVNKKFKPHMR